MHSADKIKLWLNKTTILSFFVGFIAVIAVLILLNLFRFDIEWIIGNSVSEITARYGEFDFDCFNRDDTEALFKSDVFYVFGETDEIYEKTVRNAGFYKISKGIDENRMIDGKEYCPVWVIEFDSDGYAESVKKGYYSFDEVKEENG